MGEPAATGTKGEPAATGTKGVVTVKRVLGELGLGLAFFALVVFLSLVIVTLISGPGWWSR